MRTLIYTCCDKKYSHFIPLFVAAALYSNSNIDIEIGTSAEKLDEGETLILDKLSKMYPESKILIRFNLFKELDQGHSEYNGIKVYTNTIRFIIPPVLKADYVYISDIDIIMLENDFYNIHINNMKSLNMNYSNVVRKDTTRMTGLHFSKYDNLYPINLNNIDLTKKDEEILFDIVKNSGEPINFETTLRPVHGIHMSLNRPDVGGDNNIPGWGASKWKNKWIDFKSSDIYNELISCLPDFIYNNIEKLNEYYTTI